MGELRAHLVAVKQHPHEIREALVPSVNARAWCEQKRRDGWTVAVLGERRMPAA